ncbi:fibronectin type III domain-containing protein 1-like [Saccostrea cucullata]|uniref:fibronectin type III domain-containing protein 1-like n=1 Tax=Saccostrea cuccullata TaxID=36930 RepID=UPI002ED0848A
MLCSSYRYKIFGAQNLADTFLNIADGSGSGADHCELVGGSEGHANLPGDYPYAPVVTGYYRSNFGEQFNYGTVSRRINSYWYNSWYECGVTVP